MAENSTAKPSALSFEAIGWRWPGRVLLYRSQPEKHYEAAPTPDLNSDWVILGCSRFLSRSRDMGLPLIEACEESKLELGYD